MIMISGTPNDDFLEGTDAAETIKGLAGADSIDGGAGADILYGGDGDDILTGGAGIDKFYGEAGDDMIVTGIDPEDLTGSEVYDGGAGNDTLAIYGVSEADLSTSKLSSIETIRMEDGTALSLTAAQFNTITTVEGFVPSITLTTGGNVILAGKTLSDVQGINLAAENTVLNATGQSEVYVYGNIGADTITGASGVLSFYGGDGNDKLHGGTGYNYLDGGQGDDLIEGGSGESYLLGGDGNDGIRAGASDDYIEGGLGDDIIEGGAGQDSLYGGDGNDLIYAGAGDYDWVFHGGAGSDTLSFANTTSRAVVDLVSRIGGTDAGYLAVLDFETVIGSKYGDDLSGDAGDQTFLGGKGDDYLAGLGGTDVLDGGEGRDTVVFADAANGITIDLGRSGPQNSGAGIVTLISIENVIGSAFADLFIASAGNDGFYGGNYEGDTASYVNAVSGVTVDLNVYTAQRTGGSGTIFWKACRTSSVPRSTTVFRRAVWSAARCAARAGTTR